MSIVRLKHLLLTGLSAEKEATLADLQELGCLELVPLREQESIPGAPLRPKSHEALKFLLSCPRQRHQVTIEEGFDPERVEREALALGARIQDREDERDALIQTIRDLRPWGEFHFPPLAELGGRRLWFYAVPHKLMPALENLPLSWALASSDDKVCYVLVLSVDEPEGMPVPRIRAGHASPEHLRRRLEEVILEIEDLQDQRAALTRWGRLLSRHLGQLEDLEDRRNAGTITLDHDPLFALAAWVPATRAAEIEAYAQQRGMACLIRDPLPEEEPPTLLENPRSTQPGESLVTFYMTPGYRTWDPSPVVLFSFAIFFAMIVADAGYGVIIALITLVLWKRLGVSDGKRLFQRLLVLLSVASIAFGVLCGSYFGVSPASGTLQSRVAIVDMQNTHAMMALSVVIGVLHIVLANGMNAWRYGFSQAALAPVGWALAVLGGFGLIAADLASLATLAPIAIALLAIGALLILLFSGVGKKPLPRLLSGVFAFTKVTTAFGDVLSYLRLFALGLASASLAGAFNQMAGQIRDSVAGAGLLLALLVLLIGHLLNFTLSLSSAVIHGMRLNLIEFFNWSLTDEGQTFRPFKRKGQIN